MSILDKKLFEDIGTLTKLMEKNNLSELDISDNKLSLRLKRDPDSTNKIYKNDLLIENENKKSKDKKPELSLKSPLVGTAYLSPEPGAKQFIEVGQTVKIGQVILIIEAMKTMNEIVADRNGIVKKIFIKNEAPVEFGEPLVLIE